MKPEAALRLRIEKSIYGGAGLARADGKAIFVPFTLPGELVEAHVTDDRKSYASAELDAVLEASPQRAQAACPYFGACGGCHYQHAEYPLQIAMKQQILRETLERAHLGELPEIAPVQAEPWGYRNRVRLHIDRVTSALCYKRRGSHANLAVEVCPIAAPVIGAALKAMQTLSKEQRLGEHFEEIEFFTSGDEASMLLSLWLGHGARATRLDNLWPQLKAEIPQLRGAAVFSAERGKEQGRMLAHAGERTLTYSATGIGYRVSVGSFFQVNRFLVDGLVDLVSDGRSGALAWDLYAGVGLFARGLSRSFERVVAVESAPASVSDLRSNLGEGGHRIVAATTLEFLRRAAASKEPRPDFVVVDPPRAGLGKEVTTLLTSIRPGHITYVSCDPATLSRDLKSLLDSGYHLQNIHMVDLFPQTFHLETVAILSLS
jgi:23S rRNA (uracil1939-C5)-methyltransferase